MKEFNKYLEEQIYRERKIKGVPRTRGLPASLAFVASRLPSHTVIGHGAEGADWCQKTQLWILTFRMLLKKELSDILKPKT